MAAIRHYIPNTVTCINMLSGVMAIIATSYRTDPLWWGIAGYEWAYIFVGIAALADFMDGLAARLLHAYSDMGKELDSICDVVSFGVVPAIIMYNCLDWAAESMSALSWCKWVALLIAASAALRLAKFNIDTRQATSFIGLPVPANAIFWIGYSSICYNDHPLMAEWFVVIPAILILSWLMISEVHLFSLKFKTWGWKGNQWRWILIITAPILVICLGWAGMMWLIIAYLFLGLLASRL